MRVFRTKSFKALPQFICEVCNQPITEIGMAMGAWFKRMDHPGQSAELHIVHKRECDRRQTKERGDSDGWHELYYILELMLNEFREARKIPVDNQSAD